MLNFILGFIIGANVSLLIYAIILGNKNDNKKIT